MSQTIEKRIILAPYGWKDGKPALPNPTQERVLDWIDNVRARFRQGISQPQNDGKGIPVLYLQGGAGSGKTRGFLAPIQEMLCEEAGIKVLWGRQDYNDLRLSAMQTFEDNTPAELIAGRNVQEHWMDIYQDIEGEEDLPQEKKSRGRIFWAGLKDIAGKGSQEFAVVVITEAYEISERTFRTIKMRVRQAGKPLMILMEGNPPNDDHWLSRFTNQADPDFDPDIEKWELSTLENWDNLPVGYRNSLEKMPLSWRNKYLYGKTGFMPDGTPFYHGFQESLHLQELEYSPERELLIGVDYGYNHPAIVVTQFDPFNRWQILREYLGTETLIDRFALETKAKINLHFPNAKIRIFGDPAGEQQSDKSKEVSAAIVARVFGVERVMSRPSNETGANYEARKLIIENKLCSLVNGVPEIVVDKRFCPIVRDGFLGGYHYPKRKEGQPVRGNEDVPERDGYYEHIMNALEYVAVNVFTPMRVHNLGRQRPKAPRRPRQMDNV